MGLMSLACCGASAQRSPLSDLIPTPPPLDLPAGRLTVVGPPEIAAEEDTLPDAPAPNLPEAASDASSPSDAPQPGQVQNSPGFPPVSPTPRRLPPSPGEHPSIPSLPAPCQTGVSTSTPANISCGKKVNYFQRFVDTGVHPLTPRQKAILAFRKSTDPYNFATIGFISALSTAADPGSPYGPGVPGFGRNFGVAYTETAVGEFFGTFLIPAIAHQDPHYHRMPNASYMRRIWHAITQVVWAQSDYGVGMPNYANLIGTAIGDGLGNLYVPGREKSWAAAASRYGTAIATDPIDNFIIEFLPDVARRVNVHIVLVQQIVNQVERQQ
ncbi:MAG TPA: hypothetical protein VE218_04660 [Acidobacteriaceae bacterium]|nr:hypothetical protein [Acidobacteriaceae bacterium]